MTKLLILDLDGTVRVPKSESTFISNPKDQMILPGALKKLKDYHNKKWQIVGITNQMRVALNKKTLDDTIEEQKITLQLLPEMAAIYFCPWKPEEDKSCYRVKNTGEVDNLTIIPKYSFMPIHFKKPSPGMLLMAIHDAGNGYEKALYVSNNSVDKQVAFKAGVGFMTTLEWYLKEEQKSE